MKTILILLKDLRLILADRKQLAILILMPIVLNTILGFALSGTFEGGGIQDKIKIAIVKEYDLKEESYKFLKYMTSLNSLNNDSDMDISEFMDNIKENNMESIFINKFLDSEGISSILEYEIKSLEEAKRDIENDKITSYIILPKGFIYDGLISMFTPARNKIEIEIVSNPNSNFYRNIVTEIIDGFTTFINLNILNKSIVMDTVMTNEGLEGLSSIDGLLDEVFVTEEGQEIKFKEINVTGAKPIDSFTYTCVGLLAMFMLFSAGLASKTLFDEKMEKTYQRTLITGMKNRQIFLSKFLLTIIMVVFQSITMILYSTIVLKVEWTNLLALTVITLITCMAIGSLGLLFGFITLISNNYKLVNAFESGIIQVLALLGGTYIPIEVMPDPVKVISKFTINGLFLDSMLTVLSGGQLVDTVSNLIGLSLFALLFIVLAIILLKKKGDQIAL